MGTINIQRAGQGLMDRLKRRASRNDRSLEAEALHILENATAAETEDDDKMAERIAFAESIEYLHSLTDASNLTPGVELIREDRDSDHGYDS